MARHPDAEDREAYRERHASQHARRGHPKADAAKRARQHQDDTDQECNPEQQLGGGQRGHPGRIRTADESHRRSEVRPGEHQRRNRDTADHREQDGGVPAHSEPAVGAGVGDRREDDHEDGGEQADHRHQHGDGA